MMIVYVPTTRMKNSSTYMVMIWIWFALVIHALLPLYMLY